MAKFIGLSDAPLEIEDFSFVNVIDYCTVLNLAHKCDNNYSHEMRKGRLLFCDRFVTDIRFSHDPAHGFSITCRVKAEMKKREAYNVTVNISNNNTVTDAECKCPGGKKPACCKHVFGLLAAVEDYSRLQLYKAPTEKLQQWHQPKPAPVLPMKVPDVYTESQPNVDCSVNKMALTALPQTTPIFSVLSGESPSSLAVDELFYSSTAALPVPLSTAETLSTGVTVDSLPLNQVLFYHERIKLNLSEIQKLEQATMSQETLQWQEERQRRLTASNIYRITGRSSDFLKLAQELSRPGPDLSGIKPIQFGRLNEPSVKNVLRFKFTNHTFRNTGIIVSQTHPYIAASPDGYLHHEDDPMLVEIKCVYNKNLDVDLKKLCQERKDFCLSYNADSNVFSLKKEHKYYLQIQTQLFCANMPKCLFVLMHHQLKPLHMETVMFDPDGWKPILEKLKQFYFHYFLPLLC